MRKIKFTVLTMVTLAVSLLQYCTDSPTDISSAAGAATELLIKSSTGVVDTTIVDSIGKDIDLLLAYTSGYFIDSVYINIYSGTDFSKPDTQLIIRFHANDLRDTTRLTIKFTTGGERHFQIVTYKQHGLVSTVTGTAFILAPTQPTGNTPPQFITATPKMSYYFDEEELVRFAVAATDIDGDTLSYQFVFDKPALPRGESAVLTKGYFQWQSKNGDKGIYPVIFMASDGKEATSFISTIVIGDTVFNGAPDIVSEPPLTARVGIVYEYQPIAVDDGGADFIWHLLGALPEGMTFDSITGHIWWIPEEGVVSSGPLTLKVTDFGFPQQSDSQRIAVTVEDANRSPVALSRSVATKEGTTVTVNLSASDLDDTVLTFEIVRKPVHGNATLNDDGVVTYTPAGGFKGIDTLWWIARDKLHSSDTVMLKFYVAMENQKPMARGRQVTTSEDVPVALQLSADDIEGDKLTYNIIDNPSNGTLSGTAGDRVYTPYIDFNGTDTFTFIANDGHLDSDPAKVIVVVSSVNDTPRIPDMGIPTPINTPVGITLTVTDPDDSVFTFELLRKPKHGTLDSAHLPVLGYTPENGFMGADTVSYRAVDAQSLAGTAAQIVIEVGSNNSRPIAQSQTVTGKEDTPVSIILGGTDPEGAPLTGTVVVLPRHGTLSGSGSSRTYTPHRDYFGNDTIRFTVSDGMLVSDQGVIVVVVTAVNDNPSAQSQSVAANLNSSVMILLAATDIDDTTFIFNITCQPKNGRLDTSGLWQSRIVYTPDNNFKGNDTIYFIARDGSGGVSTAASVIVAVAATNQRPVADPQNVTINEDATSPIFLTGSDLETSAANLVFSITNHPRYGQLEGNLPTISYKTAPNFNGVDTFWFAVNDGSLNSAPARVVVTVLPVNDPPSAVAKTVSTSLNAAVTIQLQANDVDDGTFTYEITSQPHHGTLSTEQIASGKVTFTPISGYKGYDTLYYRALDALKLASFPVPVIIGVALDNQPPVADPKTIILNEDTPKEDSLTGSDLENSPLTFTITRSPLHGRIENTLPKIRYVPDTDFYGYDSLLFTVSDGSATSAPAVVRFTVNPINDAPTGNQQSISTGLNESVLVILSGNDVEAGLLSFHISQMPKHGSLDTSAIRNARIVYIPGTNFKGIDTLLFVVRDNAGALSAPAAVIVSVALNNQPPVADPQQVTTPEDVPLPITLTGSDIEHMPLTFFIASNPKRGVLSGNGREYVYTPSFNIAGRDTFTFYVNDGQINSPEARVVITVAAVNDTPVVSQIQPQSITQGGTFESIHLDDYVNDPDNDDYTIVWTTAGGTNLSAQITQRVATITVDDVNWAGSETITFTATDPGELSMSRTVTFTVHANSSPTISDIDDVLINQGETAGPITFIIDDIETEPAQLTVTASSDNSQLIPQSGITLGGSDATRTITLVPFSDEFGSATIAIVVFDGISSVTGQFTITVTQGNRAPEASASGTPTSGDAPLTVGFSGSGTDPDGDDMTYLWDFDDGTTTSTEAGPSHEYTTAGTYTATLTVTDEHGLSDQATVTITVTTVE